MPHFTDADKALLISIANHRVLAVRQLATLNQRNEARLRYRLRQLAGLDLVHLFSRPLSRGRGRPENLVVLTNAGAKLLVDQAGYSAEALRLSKDAHIDHELLINDFRVQLIQLQRMLPVYTTRCFTASAPRRQGDTVPMISERIRVGEGGADSLEFIPDAVIGIRHTQLNRTLLFFLEADRGTEPASSRRDQSRGIRNKVLNYQQYFLTQGYKRYETVFDSPLRGFRLLLLAEEESRLSQLSTLVCGMPPSDFIWLTDRSRLISEGLWAPVWIRGGRANEAAHSILGSQAPQSRPEPLTVSTSEGHKQDTSDRPPVFPVKPVGIT